MRRLRALVLVGAGVLGLLRGFALLFLFVLRHALVVLAQRVAGVVQVRAGALGHQETFTTVRPTPLPASTSSRNGSRLSRPISRVIDSSRRFGRRSPAKRSHTATRTSSGVLTESTPSSETARRMNGKTVVSSAVPPVRPLAATAPPYLVVRSA